MACSLLLAGTGCADPFIDANESNEGVSSARDRSRSHRHSPSTSSASLKADAGSKDSESANDCSGNAAGPEACVCESDEPTVPAPSCDFVDFGQGITGGQVTPLYFDPETPGRVYTAANGSIFRSDDGGATFATAGDPEVAVAAVGLTPDPNTLYTLGETLSRVDLESGKSETLGLGGLSLTTLLVHPADPVHVYVALALGGVLHSDDGGRSFQAVNQGLPHADVRALIGNPDEPGRVVAALATLNGDNGWSLEGGLWYTEDFGAHWAPAYTGGRTLSLSACASDPQWMWATPYGSSPVVSSDGGHSFTPVAAAGLDEGTPVAIAVGGPLCQDVYVALEASGIYRSNDGGQTFSKASQRGTDLSPRGLFQLAVDPKDPQVVLAAYAGGAFRSTDGAENFTGVDLGFPAIRDLQTPATDPNELWMATWGSGVWRRSSPDVPWEKLPQTSLPSDYALTATTGGTSTVLVGGWPNLFSSSDGGETFTTGESCNAHAFLTDRRDENLVYAAGYYCGVLQSTDGGQTFTPSNDGLEPTVTGAGTALAAEAIVQDPQDPDVLYVGRYTDGVYVRQGAGPWTASLPVPHNHVRSLVADGEAVYAGIAGLGVATTRDRGASWQYINAGLPGRDVQDLVWDAEQSVLYVSLPTGVYRREEGGSWEPVQPGCLRASGQLAITGEGDNRYLVTSDGTQLWGLALP